MILTGGRQSFLFPPTADWSLPVADSALDEVKKLKVCIELNGLRLNKPRLPGELAHWLPSSGQRSAELHRKFRVDVPVVRMRSEVSGGWGDPTSVRRDGSTGESSRFI